MNLYKSFGASAFLLVIFTVFAGAQDESRASKTWEVQKYDITAALPQSETDRNLAVKAVLSVKNVSNKPASTLTLRISPNAEVSSVKLNDAAADFIKGEEKIGNIGTLQRIAVRVPATQSNGSLSVSVDYKLNVKENSGLSALSSAGSQFLPLSYWYPTPNSWYFARGGDFAPFRVQVNAGNGQTIVSSGTITGKDFEQKLTGQPFFVAGDWDTVNENNVSVLVPKGAGAEERKRAAELSALAANAKNFTTKLLGASPDVPLRIVAVDRGAGFSGGGTIFVDSNAFNRQKIDSQTAMSIAEAVVKIWIGNSVQVGGDAFGAIREGLPRFIATQFLEAEYGKDVADVERMRQRTAYAAVAQRDAPLNIVSPLDDYYYTEVTNKGSMVWRLLAKTIGQDEFFNILRAQLKDGNLTLSKLRTAYSSQKELLDYAFDQVTDTNLLVGLPQQTGGEVKFALRNTGSLEAVTDVVATTAGGEKLTAQVTIPAKGFGEVNFKTAAKITGAEIDTGKFYPQMDYADDVAPRDFDNSDMFLTIKRAFDKQDFAAAEKNARAALKRTPRFDDARTILARALLAQGKTTDAEKEFQTVLDEKLPTSRSIAWASQGLGETALKMGQNAQALKYLNDAVKADAEYGATLSARLNRNKINLPANIEQSIAAFFVQFDKAAVSGRKADLDALILPGEMTKFSGGIAGQAQQWTSKILQIDRKSLNSMVVEVSLNIKMLSKEVENGSAVYRLSKVDSGWKLSRIEVFEVR